MSTLLARVPREELPEQLVGAYDMAAQRTGSTDFVEAGAQAPELLDWYFNSFYAAIFYGGRNAVRTNEIIRLRLANTHGCAFCNKWDTIDAREAGLSEEEISGLVGWPEEVPAHLFSEGERAALRYADLHCLQNQHSALDEELHTELSKHFDPGQIFELGIISAVLTGMAKFIFVNDLVEKMDHCPVRPRATLLAAASGQ